MSNNNHHGFFHNLDKSAILTFLGIVLLFSGAVIVTLIAPRYVDPTWTTPTNAYQVQVYEVADPNLYISSAGGERRQFVYHLKQDYTLIAFQESDVLHIVSPPELEKYITRNGNAHLNLTSRLLLLRQPSAHYAEKISTLKKDLLQNWKKQNPIAVEEGLPHPSFTILELYAPTATEAFALAPSDTMLENWVDSNYSILDDTVKHSYHKDPGVIYVLNPMEYRYTKIKTDFGDTWTYDENGKKITDLQELKNPPLAFMSRHELINMGEHIYAIEGCWYCHTDQTRTLVQDVVLNGSDSYPAPPSSANEYVYQSISFAGTRRIGPDLSRVGVKRPSRDWHKGHFWSPQSASQGSIMPSFRHFFDKDPRGTAPNKIGIPNYQFEAIFQYLMTKGTRITPPNQAWWLGKDPIQTKEIIEGMKTIK